VLGESQRSPVDSELMEQLGINIHLIEDEDLNNLLNKLAIIEGKDGSPPEIDMNALALRVMASKLIRGSWVDPIDVDIAQLELECFMDRIEMSMDEDTYEFGGTNLLEAIAKVVYTAWSDAKGGRKAKLMKVRARLLETAVTETAKKREGILS
jgi:hypothetical protein